jgi:hypothetical protein
VSDATPKVGSQSSLRIDGRVLATRGFEIAERIFGVEHSLRAAGDYVRAASLRALREHLTTLARTLEADSEAETERARLRHEHASACDHAELLLRPLEKRP